MANLYLDVEPEVTTGWVGVVVGGLVVGVVVGTLVGGVVVGAEGETELDPLDGGAVVVVVVGGTVVGAGLVVVGA